MWRDAVAEAEELLDALAHLGRAALILDRQADARKIILPEEDALMRPEGDKDAIVRRKKSFAFFSEDADDAEGDVLDLDALSDGRFVAKKIERKLRAKDGDAGALLIVEACDGEPAIDL